MEANLLSDGEKMMFDILVACQEKSVHQTHNSALVFVGMFSLYRGDIQKKAGEF